jgi:hypothetical protein
LESFDTIISLEVVRTSQFFWPDKPTFQELHWKIGQHLPQTL